MRRTRRLHRATESTYFVLKLTAPCPKISSHCHVVLVVVLKSKSLCDDDVNGANRFGTMYKYKDLANRLRIACLKLQFCIVRSGHVASVVKPDSNFKLLDFARIRRIAMLVQSVV